MNVQCLEYQLVAERKALSLHTVTGPHLRGTVLSEKSSYQSLHAVWFHSCQHGKGRNRSRSVAAEVLGGEGSELKETVGRKLWSLELFSMLPTMGITKTQACVKNSQKTYTQQRVNFTYELEKYKWKKSLFLNDWNKRKR